MIYVDRRAIEVPRDVVVRAQKARDTLIAHAKSAGPQQRIEFSALVLNTFNAYVHKLFNQKCAYCESRIGLQLLGSVEHFRPKGSVDEEPSHRGYYWLAYEWDNLHAVCQRCSISKRNHFPIAGTRAFKPEGNLSAERAILLDPCNESDNPEQHLRFAGDDDLPGVVVPLTERGKAVISILNLNRPDLVEGRATAATELRHQLITHFQTLWRGIEFADSLKKLQDPTYEFAAVRRQVVAQWLRELAQQLDRSAQKGSETARRGQPTALIPPASVQKVVEEVVSFELAQPPKPAAVAPAPASPRTGQIRRVEITNFKSIEHLDLEFDYARAGRVGWQVFLGENGTGKSSVLQAIAMTVVGAANLEALETNPQSILRIPTEGEVAPERGSVKVWLGTDRNPIHLTFSANEISFDEGSEGISAFLRAYGPTRLLPKSDTQEPTQQPADFKRVVENLFDPYAPLCDVVRWLSDLTVDDFNKVAKTLKDVLRFRNEDNLEFDRQSGKVTALSAGGARVGLDLLSHGQQAALVLAADIISGIMRDRAAGGLAPAPGDFRDAAGIVLLDEIDAHLHPRWKMEIVPSLKRAFPYIQFLATTHEPLCLRGLEEREIVLLRREDGALKAEITDISAKGWRVDQLLTSQLFGLYSTIDPDIDAQFQAYYQLLAKPTEDLTPAEVTRRDALRVLLQRHNKLGYTRRDQMIYEIIDEYLAKEVRLDAEESRARLRVETKERVRRIWERVIAPRDE